jgi:two-component system sensor histidine kinase TctE
LVPEALSRQVDLGFDGKEPATIRGRSYLVRELIANVVENAMRYSGRGASVTVSVTRPGARFVRLCVEDDGPGIPVHERARVFERFYRVPASAGEGAGLGLSIVQEIAKGHGATVLLLDGPSGRGLRVEVQFPAAAPG